MAPRTAPVVVCSASSDAAVLSVVEVHEKSCVMSTGELLIVRWDKLRTLLEQLCQEGCPIWIRTWTTPDGEELIEAHRVGESATHAPTDRSGDSDVAF